MDIRQADASSGIAFLVSAGITYEVIAACCSSPQTAEINASTRAGTLMKWVHVGLVQAAVLVAVAAYVDRKHRKPIIAGGTAAAVVMYGSYHYAKQCGLKSAEPGTEGQAASSVQRGRVPRWA